MAPADQPSQGEPARCIGWERTGMTFLMPQGRRKHRALISVMSPTHLTGLGAKVAGMRNHSPARTIPFRPTAELM